MRRLLAVAAFAFVAASSCARRGKSNADSASSDLLKLLPKEADAVVVIPEVGAFGEKLTVLERLRIASFLAQLQGLPDARSYASAWMAQLGVDLRSREAIEKVGIDPGKPLAAVLLPDQRAYAIVRVKDEKRLSEFLQGFARQRLGAGVAASQGTGEVKGTVFSAATGAPPRLGVAFHQGWAFIGADATVASLPQMAALAPEKALSTDPALGPALNRLPTARDLWAHIPATSLIAKTAPVAGATFSARLSDDGVTVVADVPWKNAETLKLLERKDGPDLFGFLPEDAFFAARFSGDPTLLGPHWPRLVGPHLTRAFQEAAFDPKVEILENLKSGSVVSLSLAPEVRLAGMPALDVRQTNPFRYVHLTALAEALDAAKLTATLEKIPPIAPKFGARIEPGDREGKRVFITSYAQGEGVHFAAIGARALFAAPTARLDAMLARLGAQPKAPPFSSELMKTFDGRAVAAVLDLRKLATAVKELPADAWGIGGFAIKATTVRWLDATEDLRAVTLAVSQKDQAIQAELQLRLALAKAPAP